MGEFANALGSKELARLDELGIMYALRPPGARVTSSELEAVPEFPGLPVWYSIDDGATWSEYRSGININNDGLCEMSELQLVTRSSDSRRQSRIVSLDMADSCGSSVDVTSDQTLIDNMARYIELRYDVVDNFALPRQFKAKITLTNTGPDIPRGNGISWSLYFTHSSLIEPNNIRPDGVELPGTGLKVYIIQGYLYRLVPLSSFAGIRQNEMLEIPFTANYASVARTDVMPNWYLTAPNAQPRTIDNTAGEMLEFVGAFDSEEKYKRQKDDLFHPYTVEDRYNLWEFNLGSGEKEIIPTPFSVNLDKTRTMKIFDADWVVLTDVHDLKGEAEFLAEKLNSLTVSRSDAPHNRYIILDLDSSIETPESYSIVSDYDRSMITVKGSDSAGVFYGIQSILSLAAADGTVPHGQVTDQPRFEYRGLHIDVARNFRPADDIKRLIEVMSMYKMNKLHIHLSDDEGWRLEVPGLPELTELASRRCHDESGERCLLPQLGSPPGFGGNHGIGYYSVKEYQDIIQYSKDKHIQVIPEFDMPSHSHASIKAMELRYRKYKNENRTAAEEFLLSDPDDSSVYSSQQNFNDNAINPCIDSSYRFVEHIVSHIKAVHSTIQPLKVFHFGGDEVAEGAWMKSPACSGRASSTSALKQEFVRKVAEIVGRAGLELAGWEDGYIQGKSDLMDVNQLPVSKAYGYFWDNVWEWGKCGNAYAAANANYKVILSHATNLYFDHPYEPDPEDRGYYWATRYTDTKKAFSYMPDSVYENIDVGLMGNPLTKAEICSRFTCTNLELGKENNIIGMQAQIWTEVTRTLENFDYMIFPRLLALAERAWHKASWESISDIMARNEERDADWQEFANALGSKELARLDKLGIMYALRPPGARFIESESEVQALAEFPGLPIWYSEDDGNTWSQYKPGVTLSTFTMCSGSDLKLVTKSPDNRRESRVVTLDVSEGCISSCNIRRVSATTLLSNFIIIIITVLFAIRT